MERVWRRLENLDGSIGLMRAGGPRTPPYF